jgi:hypothetical protein
MGRPEGRPGTIRDGTSFCPFVPGKKKSFLVPLSLCPGTRAAAKILGRPVGQNGSLFYTILQFSDFFFKFFLIFVLKTEGDFVH